ncbi:uncharacterized protein [Spinacia oleracea]|uniref:Endonuclease/exonuclease/phosphatase domain-containing protein n=1 Tax=Spinacia oleracea TaxID=3562 RepID=A0A9R0I2M2_SPIOL|nr:uncharacterized protein LOC110781522 [Spinacia oleracea]
MKLVVWNVRGASKNDFIPYAWDIISNHKPSIFIILETKNNEDRANMVAKSLGFDKFIVVPAEGRRGGIWMFYNPNIVSLITHTEKTPSYFHALFKLNPNQPEVLITGIYAPSTSSKRHELWRELRNSLPPPSTPWLVLGDLNEVTNQTEKSGGRAFSGSQCADLHLLADAASLVDLGYHGNPYTWTNAHEGMDLIRERLDRALANPPWLNTFPNTQVLHLPKAYSDHCPVLVSVFNDKLPGPFPFRCKEI